MDVAAFVGFAASGPLHHPVLVEDVAHFQALFGEDLPLALDEARGEVVHAHLGPTVRAFFRNGGRRCWVVRVASGSARYNRFPLPGLLRRGPEGQYAPAHARARSEGSWSDTLWLSATLSSETLALRSWGNEDGQYTLKLEGPVRPEPGDLLRVRFKVWGATLLLPVEVVEAGEEGGGLVCARGTQPLWLRPVMVLDEPPGCVLRMYNDEGKRPRKLSATVLAGDAPLLTFGEEMTLAEAPPPGTPLRLEGPEKERWFTVHGLRMEMLNGKPRVQATGVLVEVSSTPPACIIGTAEACERLTFGLWVRRGEEAPLRLERLGFCPWHPRYWGALPSDLAWVRRADTEGPFPSSSPPELHEALRQDVLQPRFPLAAPRDEEASLYFPIGMGPLPEAYLGRVPCSRDALERDGLKRFEAGLFLDEELMEVGPFALQAQAHFLQYQSPRPRPLRGIHALLSKEEVTLVAVPDAVHRPWSMPTAQEKKEQPDTRKPLVKPRKPAQGRFQDCDPHIPPIPNQPDAAPSSPAVGATFELSWSLAGGQQPGPDVLFRLKVATRANADLEQEPTLYRGSARSVTLVMQGPGTYYYFVRAERDGYTSPWSPPRFLRVSGESRWTLSPTEDYPLHQPALVKLHCALLNMCAARGDLLALLSVPAHFHEDEVLAYVQELRGTPPRQPGGLADSGMPVFSHGALYHPWPILSDPASPRALRRVPPDGAACGVLARRANERGVWVTPANEPWRDVVALTPPPVRERWLELWERTPVNVVLQEPRGFVSLTASTLAMDPELEPIHVRRLLALLRRAALKLGANYTFEPNSPGLHRAVQRSFEQLLGGLLQRGAFAGAGREDSFQVVLPSSPDAGEGQGRLLVELRVAPSSPLTFLNIRLVQREDQGLFTQER